MSIRSFAVLAMLAALSGCFSDESPSPTDPGTIEELQLKGSISGRVTDSAGNPVSGVAVTLDTGGFATNTDNQGRYTIPDVPGRTWTLRFTRADWRDTSLSGIVLAIDEDRTGVDMIMRWEPDTAVVVRSHRDVIGSIGDTSGSGLRVQAIHALARNAAGEVLWDGNLGWDGVQNFRGSLPIHNQAGTLALTVRTNEGFVGADTLVRFTADTSILVIPHFRGYGNLPVVRLGNMSGAPGSRLTLHAEATDRGNGRIARIDWNVDGSGFLAGGADTTIVVPAGDGQRVVVLVRATDNTGAWTQDTAYITLATGLVDIRDGRAYRTVTLGGQTWMAENLDHAVDNSWWYENSADSGAKYGRLYTWAAAMALDDSCNRVDCMDQVVARHQGACPLGWHVPTDAEWRRLTDTTISPDSANRDLKSSSGWAFPFYDGLDRFGFSVRPSGLGQGSQEVFSGSGFLAYFWSAEMPSQVRLFGPADTLVAAHTTESGLISYSVRCLAD